MLTYLRKSGNFKDMQCHDRAGIANLKVVSSADNTKFAVSFGTSNQIIHANHPGYHLWLKELTRMCCCDLRPRVSL